ncbi:hypothetical protein IEO21_08428 [Rhodonia placenta]|uniref:Uncharacterized protein n=1 Tax=Rhodonia placenta TaxID=104341 RepID=A0A8H7NWD5_9APHY|nr:hypothetical protein IEO21_08428 [Postia placenta]
MHNRFMDEPGESGRGILP